MNANSEAPAFTYLWITSDHKFSQTLAIAAAKHEFFNYLVPLHHNTYEEAMEKWGTRYDAADFRHVRIKNEIEFSCCFRTTWCPPTNIFPILQHHPLVQSYKAISWEPETGGLCFFENGHEEYYDDPQDEFLMFHERGKEANAVFSILSLDDL